MYALDDVLQVMFFSDFPPKEQARLILTNELSKSLTKVMPIRLISQRTVKRLFW